MKYIMFASAIIKTDWNKRFVFNAQFQLKCFSVTTSTLIDRTRSNLKMYVHIEP